MSDRNDENRFSHISDGGEAEMVDVSGKKESVRKATASGRVVFPQEVFEELASGGFTGKKGSIMQTAVIAGIQAVKRTADLIPLCHPLPLSNIDIDIEPEEPALHIRCSVSCTAKTGVEMEALTGVSVSALTIYDMCKALSHDIQITEVRLEHKSGGTTNFSR